MAKERVLFTAGSASETSQVLGPTEPGLGVAMDYTRFTGK
jgi:hypothetical protein